jgi:hypothetical protein
MQRQPVRRIGPERWALADAAVNVPDEEAHLTWAFLSGM